MKFLSFLAFFTATMSFAQKNLILEESIDIIQKAYDYQQEESYEKAIAEYEKISINDTNYPVAQYEIAVSYMDLDQPKKAREVLNSLINNKIKFDFQQEAYTALGRTHLMEGDSLTALKVFNEGISKFPMAFRLYYNRALTHEKLKNYPAAVEDYQRCIRRNIYFADAHIQLGLLAAHEERYTEAALCFATFFLIDPDNRRSAALTTFAEQMANGSFSPESKDFAFTEDDPYSAINLLFKNKVALDKKYKVSLTVPTDYGKQLHLILSNVKYDESDDNFWNQNYVKLLKEFFDMNKLDEMVLMSVSDMNSAAIQKKLKSKKAKVIAFINIAGSKFLANAQHQYVEYEGSMQKVFISYDEGILSYIGKLNDKDEADGNYYYYHENGALMMVAQYEDDKPLGSLDFYSSHTGKIEKKFIYKDGDENKRTEEYYYPSGELSVRINTSERQIVDTLFRFYRSGTIKEKTSYKEGKRDGPVYEYYANGAVSYIGNFKNDLANGDFQTFHRNGQKKAEFSYVDDKLEGKRTIYYPDGKIESVYNFKEGNYDGPYEEYNPLGKLVEKGTYKKDKTVGELINYYDDGVMSKKVTLDENGKENGTSQFFDETGRLYHEIDFVNGDIKEIRYIDEAKKSTVLAKKKGKTIDYVFNYPSGRKNTEGKYVDGLRTGLWTFYDYYGNIKSTSNYENGLRQGESIDYHPNGQIHKKLSYDKGDANGIYVQYDIHGNLEEEGKYLNDDFDREWFAYHGNGEISDEYYYVDGEKHGFQLLHAINGKIKDIEEYEEGILINNDILDTNGVVVRSFGEYHGEIELYDPTNKYVDFRASYLNGENNGKLRAIAPNKLETTVGQFENNLRVGEWKWYHLNGKLRESCTYVNGDIVGVDNEYFENGKLKSVENYVYDMLHGPFKYYYEDGTLSMEGNMLHDERHGQVTSYGPDGGVFVIRNYDDGNIKSYTYLGKDGKPVPPIELTKDLDSMITYYKNGKVALRTSRASGLLEGKYELYYENGQIFERENYKHGELHGEMKEYYKNGTLKMEANYIKGYIDGPRKTYHPNGKIHIEEVFIYGKRHGVYKEYSADGKLLHTIVYYDGELVSYN